ncbi:MAG: TrbG/VirB9 family P-type conjugative transfer protein, partial [Treponema sp.]|nr:TrbG/VirB9 family P-type conjugative transfer protein [Treponema sp.]
MAAVQESAKAAVRIPLKYVNGMMYYPWDETFVYEIHTTPYRTTDIQLEPGEQVLEMPFLSEEKVWEIGAGVSRKNGQ